MSWSKYGSPVDFTLAEDHIITGSLAIDNALKLDSNIITTVTNQSLILQTDKLILKPYGNSNPNQGILDIQDKDGTSVFAVNPSTQAVTLNGTFNAGSIGVAALDLDNIDIDGNIIKIDNAGRSDGGIDNRIQIEQLLVKIGTGDSDSPQADLFTVEKSDGTDILNIDSTTTPPRMALTGDITVSGSFKDHITIDNGKWMRSATHNLTYLRFEGENVQTRAEGSGNFSWLGSAGTQRMKLTNAGNLGIGAGTPLAPLHIKSGAEALRLGRDSYSTYYKFNVATDMLTIRDGNTNAYIFHADSSSIEPKIGIGTTSPNSTLHLKSSTTSAVGITMQGNTSKTGVISASNVSFLIRGDTGTPLDLQTDGPNSRIFIASDGKVGIGTTTSPIKLHVVGSSGDPTSSGAVASGAVMFAGGSNTDAGIVMGRMSGIARNWLQVQSASNTAITANMDLLLQPLYGKVGIGVTEPLAPLHIARDSNVGLMLDTPNAGDANYARVKLMYSSYKVQFKRVNNGGAEEASPKFVFDMYGKKFGIGTDSPDYPLHILSAGSVKHGMVETTDSADARWWAKGTTETSRVAFGADGGSYAAQILNENGGGINMYSGSDMDHLAPTGLFAQFDTNKIKLLGDAATNYMQWYNTSSSGTGDEQGFTMGLNGTAFHLTNREDGNIQFSTHDTTRMILDSDGFLKVTGDGTTGGVVIGNNTVDCTDNYPLKVVVPDLTAASDVAGIQMVGRYSNQNTSLTLNPGGSDAYITATGNQNSLILKTDSHGVIFDMNGTRTAVFQMASKGLVLGSAKGYNLYPTTQAPNDGLAVQGHAGIGSTVANSRLTIAQPAANTYSPITISDSYYDYHIGEGSNGATRVSTMGAVITDADDYTYQAWTADATYTNQSPSDQYGPGTGAKFTITTNGSGVPTATVEDYRGSGYKVDSHLFFQEPGGVKLAKFKITAVGGNSNALKIYKNSSDLEIRNEGPGRKKVIFIDEKAADGTEKYFYINWGMTNFHDIPTLEFGHYERWFNGLTWRSNQAAKIESRNDQGIWLEPSAADSAAFYVGGGNAAAGSAGAGEISFDVAEADDTLPRTNAMTIKRDGAIGIGGFTTPAKASNILVANSSDSQIFSIRRNAADNQWCMGLGLDASYDDGDDTHWNYYKGNLIFRNRTDDAGAGKNMVVFRDTGANGFGGLLNEASDAIAAVEAIHIDEMEAPGFTMDQKVTNSGYGISRRPQIAVVNTDNTGGFNPRWASILFACAGKYQNDGAPDGNIGSRSTALITATRVQEAQGTGEIHMGVCASAGGAGLTRKIKITNDGLSICKITKPRNDAYVLTMDDEGKSSTKLEFIGINSKGQDTLSDYEDEIDSTTGANPTEHVKAYFKVSNSASSNTASNSAKRQGALDFYLNNGSNATTDDFVRGMHMETSTLGSMAYSTAFGAFALDAGANHSTAFGWQALMKDTGNSYNVAVGRRVLSEVLGYGVRNTGVGYDCLNYNVTGDQNTAVGAEAGRYYKEDNSVFVGNSAGKHCSNFTHTYGNDGLTFVGGNAGENHYAGANSVGIGFSALRSLNGQMWSWTSGGPDGTGANGAGGTSYQYSGQNNTAIGKGSLQSLATHKSDGTTHTSQWGNGSGAAHNTAVGYNSLYALRNGQWNTVVGANAVDRLNGSSNSNTIIGHGSGAYYYDNDWSTLVGKSINSYNLSTGMSGCVAVGASALYKQRYNGRVVGVDDTTPTARLTWVDGSYDNLEDYAFKGYVVNETWPDNHYGHNFKGKIVASSNSLTFDITDGGYGYLDDDKIILADPTATPNGSEMLSGDDIDFDGGIGNWTNSFWSGDEAATLNNTTTAGKLNVIHNNSANNARFGYNLTTVADRVYEVSCDIVAATGDIYVRVGTTSTGRTVLATGNNGSGDHMLHDYSEDGALNGTKKFRFAAKGANSYINFCHLDTDNQATITFDNFSIKEVASAVLVVNGEPGSTVTGKANVAVGYAAGNETTSGTHNTFVGTKAGVSNVTGIENTFVGNLAGDTMTTGKQCTAIGKQADVVNTGINQTAIGYGAVTTADNTVMLGNSAITGVYNGADTASFEQVSDERLKRNIKDWDTGLDVIDKIEIKEFNFKENSGFDPSVKRQGVIAQQVKEVMPEMVKENDNGFLSVNNDPLVYALVNAVKELSQEVKDLKEKLNEQ